MKEITVKEITVKQLVEAFEGKHIDVSPMDHYGIAIEMHRGTIEYEDELRSELYLVLRDKKGNVTGSICIDEDSIESIDKEDDGSYTVDFTIDMAAINISESLALEELDEKDVILMGELDKEDVIRIGNDVGELYMDDKSDKLTEVEETDLTEPVFEMEFISE